MIRLFYFFRRLWYRNVYLRSKHWRTFRLEALRASGWRCEWNGCNAIDVRRPILYAETYDGKRANIQFLDVHHLTYENLGHETIADVQVLCRHHHKMIENRKR